MPRIFGHSDGTRFKQGVRHELCGIAFTSIGNIIGDTYWPGENAESLFYTFISTTDAKSVKNAVKYNGKSEQQTIDDTARELGSSQDQVEALVNRAKAADAQLDWNSPSSGSNSGSSSTPKYSFSKLPDGTLELTDYNGTDKYVAIPSTIKGEPIYIYTGANAFEKCLYLESVKLSENLTEIADEAFFDCRRLTEINIPDGVTSIGEEAFYNCRSLKELVLPNSVQSVGKEGSSVGAFEDCKALSKIVLPDNVRFIEDNAFEGCRKLTVSAETGSYAAAFATENSLPFERMGGVTAQGKLIGDVSGNNTVSIDDVSDLQKFLAEFDGNTLDLSDPAVIALADVNRDGRVTVKDVMQIQRFLAEILEAF